MFRPYTFPSSVSYIVDRRVRRIWQIVIDEGHSQTSMTHVTFRGPCIVIYAYN